MDTVSTVLNKQPLTAEENGNMTVPNTPDGTNSKMNCGNSQFVSTPTSEMSSSLKERLKRCGRYHPATPPSSGAPSSRRYLGNTVNTPTSLSRNVQNPSHYRNPKSVKGVSPRNILLDKSNKCSDAQNTKMSVSAEDNELDKVYSINNQDRHEQCHPACSQEKDGSGETVSTFKTNSFACENIATVEPNRVSNFSTRTEDKQVLSTAFCKDTCSSTELSPSKNSSLQDIVKLKLTKKQLHVRLTERKEVLRKLNMVKTYRLKNDVCDLKSLINKWRDVCQQAVLELHQLTKEREPSLSQLVHKLGIEKELVHFNEDEECFDD